MVPGEGGGPGEEKIVQEGTGPWDRKREDRVPGHEEQAGVTRRIDAGTADSDFVNGRTGWESGRNRKPGLSAGCQCNRRR